MKTETIIKGLQTALNENAVADEFKFLITKAKERLIEYSANETGAKSEDKSLFYAESTEKGKMHNG